MGFADTVSCCGWIIWISVQARAFWLFLLVCLFSKLVFMFHASILSCNFALLDTTYYCFFNIDFVFQSLNFMFGAEMVHFNSCTSSFSLLISSTSNWFSMTLQADSPISAQSGCLFVAILEFVQIIWWPELGFSSGVQVCLVISSFACLHVLFLSSLLMQGGGY